MKKKEKKKELLNKRKEGEDLRRKRCRERNCHRFGESFWPIFRVESNRSISRSCNYVSSMPPSKVASCATVRRKRPRGHRFIVRWMLDFLWNPYFPFLWNRCFQRGKKLIAQNWFQLNNSWKIYVIINLCLLYNFNIEFGGRNRSNVVLEINL